LRRSSAPNPIRFHSVDTRIRDANRMPLESPPF
jgi:hypothetical protein